MDEKVIPKVPKIYRMNDFDTVIAYSKDRAVEFYFNEDGVDGSIEEIRKECKREHDLNAKFWYMMGDKKLVEKIYSLGEYDEIIVGRFAGELSIEISFKEAIEKYLDSFDIPGIICSTEY